METLAKQKQLKKNDFLMAVNDTPMTRGDLVEKLDDYSYIPTYLDFLIEHFTAQGKIVVNADGTFNRKGKKPTAPGKDAFRVVVDANGDYTVTTKPFTGAFNAQDKEDGWAVTKQAAIKRAGKAIFAEYKFKMDSLNQLKDVKEVVESEVDEV
jgi:hypothetical protein